MESERRMWFAVIERAIEDARGEYIRGEGKGRNAMKEAQQWLLEGGDDFRTVCWYAGVSPEYVQKLVRKKLPQMLPQRRKTRVVVNEIFAGFGSSAFASSCAASV